MGGCDSKEKAVPVVETTIPEFKVIVIGDSGVGKTAIIHSFIHETFANGTTYVPSTGVANQYKTMTVPGSEKDPSLPKKIKLDIWDTTGSHELKNMTSSHYKGSHAVIIVYAINSLDSMKSVDMHNSDVDQNCHEKVLRFMVGNKCDLDNDRHVAWDDAQQRAEDLDIPNFFETSANQDKRDTVVELFNEVVL